MNIAVFASGRGSNFEAILNAIQHKTLAARVCVVLSNNSTAGALDIGRRHEIPAFHVSSRQFPSDELFAARVLSILTEHKTDFIALAGYMKKLPGTIIGAYRNRIANIHPALLPAFGGEGMYGSHVHEKVIASGVRISGATVHLVDDEYDKGPIVLQQTVPVDPTDTPESLASKVLAIEHQIYPLVLTAFAEGRVRIKGNTAWIEQPKP